MWVVRTLLDTVRGAVRSAEEGKRLRDHFHSYGDKVELRVVEEDITKEGAFDEAVKGVGAIVHTAPPLSSTIVDPDDMCPCLIGALHDLMCPKHSLS